MNLAICGAIRDHTLVDVGQAYVIRTQTFVYLIRELWEAWGTTGFKTLVRKASSLNTGRNSVPGNNSAEPRNQCMRTKNLPLIAPSALLRKELAVLILDGRMNTHRTCRPSRGSCRI
jgi:hypothetical protein